MKYRFLIINVLPIILTLHFLMGFTQQLYGYTTDSTLPIKNENRFADKTIEILINNGNFKKAYEYCISYIENNQKNNQDLLAWYRTAAYLQSRLGEYQNALSWEDRALKVAEKFGDHTKIYADILNELSTYNSRISCYDEAIRLCSEALRIYEDIEGCKLNYAISLNNLSHYEYKKGDFNKALKLCKEAKFIITAYAPQSMDYMNVIQNMAHYKSRLGQYMEAIQLCEEAEIILIKNLGSEHPDHAILLSDMATYWSRIGEYIKAKEIEEQAIKIRYAKMGDMHPDYAVSLNRLAHYYYKLGNFQEALTLCLIGNRIQEQILPKNHFDHMVSLNDLGKYYAAIDSIDMAIQVGLTIKELYQQYYPDENTDYANALSNLALYYDIKGEYDKAISLEENVLKIRELKLSAMHPDFAKSLASIAVYKSRNNDYKSAIDYAEKALRIQEKTLGMQHPDVLNSLINLASIHFSSGNYKEGEKYAQLATEIYVNKLKNSFQCLTAQERKTLWDKNRLWFSDMLPNFVNTYDSKLMRAVGFNAVLFSKGILQNSVIEFSRFLSNSNDESLIKKYDEMRNLQIILNRQYEKPISERNIDTDSLENTILNIEKEIVYSCKDYGDYTRNISVSWEKVRDNLNYNDVAIEFLKVPINNDSIIYMAYVLKSDTEAPELVRLFYENELESIDKKSKRAVKRILKDVFQSVEATELIWGKLRKYIENADNIYFAVDGKLHQIGIEYFINFDGDGMLADRHLFHRLSSTRQIAISKERHRFENSKLFGGIIYDTNPDNQNINTSEYYSELASSTGKYRGTQDAEVKRSAVGFLKNTDIEVKTIQDLLMSKDIQAIVICGKEATEESVKSMSGSSPDIIHIATHGYVWQKNEADEKSQLNKNLVFLSQTNENASKYEDTRAMSRTALIMAGANNTLMGVDIPDGVEDGILTATEIAQLDLGNADLVVLSSCQSGLGDISSDGVYGLQRGFKMAGANSILMSLWNVDDIATQMLMTNFYRNLINGECKIEAFLNAQKYVKNFDGYIDGKRYEFSNPYFWAAFVFLDALN